MRVLRPALCALFVFCSVVLFQCKKDDDKPATPTGVEVSITADKTTVTFPSKGGNYEVKITSSGDWNVKEEIAWLEATKVDNTLLKVTCEANTGAERSDKVTATIEGESVEITVTQSQPLGTLSTDRYTISSSEATNASLVLDVSFETAATEWWITGADGATIPTFTSASPASDSKADVSSRTFTYSIGANSTGTAIPVSLEFHISGETGGASLTMLPFTVTQGTQQITALLPVSFSVSEASAGSHTLTFTSLTLTGSATHWWLTGDASLPASVSLSPDKDDKKMPGTTTFTVTLPRNETDQVRTYKLIFHAGSSVTPSDLALDVRSFTVTQPARLASVASASLDAYHASGGNLTADLSDADDGLSLTFENATSHYWWISQTDGTTIFSSGLTNVSPSVTRAQTDVSTLSFTLSPCTGTADCSYDLMLNIATGMSAEATDQIPFTLTQSKALGSLGTMNYSLASGLASGETLTFTGLSFTSEAAEWWITGQDGAAITSPLSSVSPDESSKAMLDQSDLPDGFTYSIGANAGTARELSLEIQIAAVAGEAPLTTLPFTLTQDGTTLGALATIKDTISADGATDATYIFKGLVLNSGTHWWITGKNGAAISNLTSVMPDNDNRRTHDAAKSFIYTSSDNAGNDIDIDLEIQIAPSANAAATKTLSFTMTQSKPLISSIGTNDDITSAASGTYTVTFSNRMFAEGTTHWWITGNSADRSLPAGVSVNVDAESKALASATTFNITVPENLTTSPQTFTLLLHAGTSSLAAEPSLHAEMFDVVQAGKLVTLGDDTYEIDAGTQATAAVNFAQLALRSDMTHWWITSAANGDAASTIDGITSVSHHSGNRQVKGTNSFTMNVSQNPEVTDRDFMLELHVGKSTGASQGSLPFTVTQEASTVLLSTANYDIPAAANTSLSIDFTGMQFKTGITHWWITAAGGSAASTIDGITSVSHDGSTASKRVARSTTSFTINVSQNSGAEDRVFNLALQVGESAGAAQGSVPFTVTQAAGAEVTLSKTSYDIPAAANPSAAVDLGSAVKFKTGITHWWITGESGGAIPHSTTVSATDGNRARVDATLSFTMNVSQNPTDTDRDFALVLHVGESTGNSEGSVPFTVTQAGTVPEGLIPVSTLEQLNAIRYDLDGNGKVSGANEEAYAKVFPGVVSAITYTGYKLVNDLDFNEDASYIDPTTNKPKWTPNKTTNPTNSGWSPIGTGASANSFNGVFDGGGHTISNLYTKRTTFYLGLFGYVDIGGTIRKVGMVSPNVTGGRLSRVGGLVGRTFNSATTISFCYVSGGTITGGMSTYVGGIVGQQGSSTIRACYVSQITATGGDNANVGGLVGHQQRGTIRACYVYNSSVTGGNSANVGSLVGDQAGTIIASYAGGKDYTISLRGAGSGTVTNSYSQKATVSDSDNADKTVHDKTRAALQTPTNTNAYNSGMIYENWNLNLDSNDATQDPWDFGTSSDYPKLKVDFDGNGTASVSEFGSQ